MESGKILREIGQCMVNVAYIIEGMSTRTGGTIDVSAAGPVELVPTTPPGAEPVEAPTPPTKTGIVHPPREARTEAPPVDQGAGTPDPEPGGLELDSEGLPWDARIHGEGRKKLVKTKAWKLIRGIDPVLVAQVKTELRGVNPVAAPGAAPAGGALWDFTEFISAAAAAKIQTGVIEATITEVTGLAGLTEMVQRPELVDKVAAALRLTK